MTNQRSRTWAYTIFDYEDDNTLVLAPTSTYQVYGYEVCPETQRKHLQGYISFSETKTMSSVKKMFRKDSMHLEIPKGTSEQNRAYCIKEGNYIETGLISKQGKRTDLEKIKDLIKEGKGMRDIIDIAPNFQAVRMAEVYLKYAEQKRDWKTETTWIWGKSGTGKTRLAIETLGKDAYVKNNNTGKWWDGYDADENVIIDEVDYETNYSLLKELSDRYPCRVETKGGSRQFLAKKLIITSLYNPADLYHNKPELGKEMLRRIDNIIFLM